MNLSAVKDYLQNNANGENQDQGNNKRAETKAVPDFLKVKNRNRIPIKIAEERFKKIYADGVCIPHQDGGFTAINEDDLLFLVKMLLLRKPIFISGKTGKAKTRIMQSIIYSLPYICSRWGLGEIKEVLRVKIPLVTQAQHLLDGQRILKESNGNTVTSWEKSEVRRAIEQYGYTIKDDYNTQEKECMSERIVILYGDEIDRLRPQVIDGLLQIIGSNIMEYDQKLYYYDFASIFTGNYIASIAVDGYSGVNELDQAFLRRMITVFEPRQDQDFEMALVQTLYPDADKVLVEKLFKLMELLETARYGGELSKLREISVYNLMSCLDSIDMGLDVERAVELTLASGLFRGHEQYEVLRSKIDGVFAREMYKSKNEVSSKLW